ncbi:Toxoplasma gondii family A protein, partial [Toxoplasma gondii MAS]
AATSTTTKSPTGAVESTTRPSESTESSSSGPTVSSGSTSQSSGGESTLPGSGAEGGTSGDSSENTDDAAHPQVPQPPASVPPSQPPNTNEEEEDKDTGSGEAHEDGPTVEGPNKGDAGNGSADSGPSGVVAPGQTETQPLLEPSGTGNDLPVADSSSALPQQSQDPQHITNNKEPALSDSTDLAGSKAPDHSAETPASTMSQGAVTGSAGNDGVAEGNARLRRLSDTETSSIKYLTIIVHSAAVGSSAGTLTLSAALLSITATFCLAFDYGI